MCFLERHVSDVLPQGENLDVWEGDRGGSCRFQSPLLFLFQAFGWHGRTGPLPKDHTQVGELARFQSLRNERDHEQTKSTAVGMDRKPAAKPTERPPTTPAVTRTQTVDVRRAAKARALAYKDTLPGNNARTTAVRGISSEGSAARRRSAAAASSEAAAAQQRRAEGLAARGARPAHREQ